MTSIPHEMDFELYHYPESLCSQMVRLALEEKAIEWKSHPIMLNDVVLEGDNFKPEYLRVNPKGIVPTLVHKGQPIYDSWTIIDYLDKAKPDSGTLLTPKDADKLAQMQALIEESSLDESRPFGVSLGTAIPILSTPVIRYLIKQQPLFAFWWKYRKHPMWDRRWGARLVTLMPVPKTLSHKSIKTVGRALKNIEALLAHGEDYLLGSYSQVDIMMTAHFHRLEDVELGTLLQSDALPNTAKYWQRLQSRPTYKKAIIDWHEAVWRSALNTVFKGQTSPVLDKVLRVATA